MNNYAVLNTVFSTIGGAIIGGAITYVVVKKHFEDYAATEIAETRKHYSLLRKEDGTIDTFKNIVRDEVATVEAATEDYAKAKDLIERMGYADTSEVPQPIDINTDGRLRNAFDHPTPETAVGIELDGPNGKPVAKVTVETISEDPMAGYVRFSGQPYIISSEEYYETEVDWDKATLIYYEGDDTLVDEQDKKIDDVEKYIGGRHLDMFGVLSNDKNGVFVRNAQMSVDFEVIREKGKAAVMVWGQPDDETRKEQLRRMRPGD